MDESLDLMETLAGESGNVFRMNRRGYLYVTGMESKIADLEKTSQESQAWVRVRYAFTRRHYTINVHP